MITLDLLFKRARGEAAREDYVDWATELLGSGRSEPGLVKIAADPDIDPADRDRALTDLLPLLGFRMPQDLDDLIAILEEALVADYAAGRITGVELIQRSSDFWRLSEYSPRFRLWHDLDEDISLSEEGYGPIFYEMKKDDLEASILRVLRKERRIPG